MTRFVESKYFFLSNIVKNASEQNEEFLKTNEKKKLSQKTMRFKPGGKKNVDKVDPIARNLIPFHTMGLQRKTEALFRKIIIDFFVDVYLYFTIVKIFWVRSPLRSP